MQSDIDQGQTIRVLEVLPTGIFKLDAEQHNNNQETREISFTD